MSNKLTYIEARDKIWNAYFRDEIQPFDPTFCFCGTLSPDKKWWQQLIRLDYPYSISEYANMEIALFEPMGGKVYETGRDVWCTLDRDCDDFEEKLFAGMIAALEVLKQIHRDRGDFIPEDEPLLTKRKLFQTVR